MSEIGLPKTALRWELTGAGIERFGRDGKVSEYPVAPPGPGEMLARVDTCGICFSDIKILNLGGDHPRLRGRDLEREPVTMGHEVSLTILAVGDGVTAPFGPGDRAIVQADVYYKGQGMAMGYRLPGGFSQYVTIGRDVLEGDEGCYLLPVPPHLAYSEAALCEPWACVEASYRYQPRRSFREGGSMLVITNDVEVGDVTWPRSGPQPASVTVLGDAIGTGPACFPGDRSTVVRQEPGSTTGAFIDRCREEGTLFDDVILIGRAGLRRVQELLSLVARSGIFCLVRSYLGAPIAVDVGRVHYEDVGIVGTTGADIGRAYAEGRSAELTPGGIAWFIGAGGPMGQMHLQRAISLPHPPRTIVATQNTGLRHRDLIERFAGPAAERGINLVVLNPKEMSAEELDGRLHEETGGLGFDDIVCLVPSIPAIEQTPRMIAPGGGVNLFAGVPVGTTARLDLEPILRRGVRYWGTSGSTIADLASTEEKLAHGSLETAGVVAAIAGIHGVRDGLAGVKEGRYLGKTVIYPQIEDLPLLSIAEVAERYPSVSACLTRGRYWNREAEAALLREFER